jgi:hypothetical protein
VYSVYINKDALLECFDIIHNENGWDDISIRESFGLARLLNNEIFLYFLSLFHSVLLYVDILYNTLHKVSSNAVSVPKAI